ncbi:uncharacterized protein LOC143539508 [Bidens hawaiensis]|uniref:uncharacterized protein LOC143539508 n=1 Tax=Bidens hawaiensis TaxID=980011 RepID=UPI00404AA41F
MNKVSKPISSPGRTDKFPPPLMRFLRSNVGSKSSRRRSRASPMFLRKKNTLIEEPSSPKVTCIGQVRVRRSNNKTTAATTSLHRLCRCLRSIKSKPFITVWTQCFSLFQSRSCCWSCYYCNTSNNNSVDLHASPSPVVTETVIDTVTTGYGEVGKLKQQEQQEDENEIFEKVDNIINETTPKNALLLTRCRSAPYRSSSLASIFRESMMEKTGEEEEEPTNPSNGLLAKFTVSGYIHLSSFDPEKTPLKSNAREHSPEGTTGR